MAMPRFVFQLVWLIVTIRCFDKCNKQNRRRRFCLFACFVLDLHCWCFGARKIALASAKFSSGVTKRFGRWNFWRFENFATSQRACQKTPTKQQQRFMWCQYASIEGLPWANPRRESYASAWGFRCCSFRQAGAMRRPSNRGASCLCSTLLTFGGTAWRFASRFCGLSNRCINNAIRTDYCWLWLSGLETTMCRRHWNW